MSSPTSTWTSSAGHGAKELLRRFASTIACSSRFTCFTFCRRPCVAEQIGDLKQNKGKNHGESTWNYETDQWWMFPWTISFAGGCSKRSIWIIHDHTIWIVIGNRAWNHQPGIMGPFPKVSPLLLGTGSPKTQRWQPKDGHVQTKSSSKLKKTGGIEPNIDIWWYLVGGWALPRCLKYDESSVGMMVIPTGRRGRSDAANITRNLNTTT